MPIINSTFKYNLIKMNIKFTNIFFMIFVSVIAGFSYKCSATSSVNRFRKAGTGEVYDNKLPSAYTIINILQKDTIPADWKKYSGELTGIYFRYPGTWVQNSSESGAVNTKGTLMSVSVNFTDTVKHSVLFITFYLPPYGAEHFKAAQDQLKSQGGWFGKNTQKITVAGKEGIETFTTIKKDIRGTVYDPPLSFVHIVFPDKTEAGEYEFHFRTPVTESEKENRKFKLLLSTVNFIK